MTPHQPSASRPVPALGRGDIRILDADDSVVCTELPGLRSVGVADLTEVLEHRVNVVASSVAHFVRFRNDGELYYVFNSRGQLVELTARALRITISSKGDYLFRQP